MNNVSLTTDANRPMEKLRAIRVLHLTDFHFRADPGQTMLGVDTEQSFMDVLQTALASSPAPDLALLTGDLVQDPCVSAYRRLKKRLAELEFPCYCVPGNHDDARLIAEVLAGDNVYFQSQVLLDHWQIICLDSTIPHRPEGRLPEEQLHLLKTLLDAQPERFALIALHHHPVFSGSLWMDTMVLANADRLFAVLESYTQVRGVVFGHIHQTMDSSHKGLRLLGSPSTCFQFEPHQADFAIDAAPPGYRWIDLYPDGRIETTVERLAKLPAGLDFTSAGYR